MAERKYEDWISILQVGTDYEADLVRDRLDDSGVDAVVLTQRDHAFNLNVGDLSDVHVMVPPEQVDEARKVLETKISDEELEEAAASADPEAPPAHDDREEAMLDSGMEEMHFSEPDEESDEKSSE